MKKLKSFGGKNLGGGGATGKMPKNLNDLQKLQNQIDKEMEKLEEEFANVEVQVEVGGALKVIATCDRKVKDIIYPEDLVEDKEMFKDMLIAAMSEVMQKIEETRDEKTNEIMRRYMPFA